MRENPVISSGKITNPGLLEYLEQRKIPVAIANQFCRRFALSCITKNNWLLDLKMTGGYELRSQNFKGSSSPKEPVLIRHEGSKVSAVFEGFFDFLSFQTLQKIFTAKSSWTDRNAV